MRAFHCFSFVIANSFDDARLSVLAHMYPNKRTEFDLAYESNYYALEMPPRVRFVNRDIQPRLSSYLEVDSRRSNDPDDEKASGRMTSTIKTAAREQPEQNKTDQLRDLSLDDDVLPGWFKTAAQSEAHGGPYGCRLQYLSALIGSGCFYPTPYLQDPEDIAACFASLRARRVLYGIMFQKYREQLQKDNKKIDDFRVEEIAHRGRELCELSIPPLWFIRDAADLKGTRLLPSLFEMESLDIAHRRKIFAIAMVDDSEWLDGLGPDAREFEFNLLLLRSWALRSPFLQKAHVTVLLLSILWMEKKYDKETRFFPWPIALRRSAIMWLEGEKGDKKAPTNHKHLLPFAQLQSVTETAFFLNFALKTPHGLRVASVREFYSEVSFHNLLAKWIGLNELGQKRQLAELLEADCLGRFSSFVDALYDKPETAPSPSCLKANGLSQDQIAAENSLARLLAVHHGEGNMSSFILESPARENDQDLILEKA